MYQEWIKGRSLTSTNAAELMEKEALEKERKEGNEKFDLGEESTAGTADVDSGWHYSYKCKPVSAAVTHLLPSMF